MKLKLLQPTTMVRTKRGNRYVLVYFNNSNNIYNYLRTSSKYIKLNNLNSLQIFYREITDFSNL